MKFNILNITKETIMPEGKVFFVHTNQLDTDKPNKNLVFIFPQYMEMDIYEGILVEYKEEGYWEPDFEEEYILCYSVDINGMPKIVAKQRDFDAQYPVDEFFDYMTHQRYSSLMQQTFNVFVLNEMADNAGNDENTCYYVFDYLTKQFSIKPYYQVRANEAVFQGYVEIAPFTEYIKPKFQDDFADFLIDKIVEREQWPSKERLLQSNERINWFKLMNFAKEFYGEESPKLGRVKMSMARFFLAKHKVMDLDVYE